jgi:hypothetical protein
MALGASLGERDRIARLEEQAGNADALVDESTRVAPEIQHQ